ncbi:SH3 domain-containing protein, partial [Acinetobacter baumannii]
MYQYNAQDAGDLALMPNDKVVVTEYMNSEWWKG